MKQLGSGWFQSGLVAVTMGVLAACGSFSSNEASEPPAPDADGGGTGSDDGAPGVGNSASPFVVSLQAGPRVELIRGKRTDVVVQIERRNGFLGEVVVTVRGLPQGVAAEPLVILPSEKIGTLGLTATDTVPHGVVEPVLVAAGRDSAVLTGEAKFQLVLRGAPGSLDETFGKKGVVELSLPGVSFGGMALQADGKLVYAGAGPTAPSIVIGRLLANGAIDTTYGTGGTRGFAFGAGVDRVRDVFVQPDGKAVLVGSAGTDNRITLARLTAAGALDTTFAGTGMTSYGTNTRASRARLADDGSIFLLAAGDGPQIVKFTSTGVLDTTFGGGAGFVVLSKSAFTGSVVGLSASSLAISATSVTASFTVVRNGSTGSVGIATIPRAGGQIVYGDSSVVGTTQYENPIVVRSDNSTVVGFNSFNSLSPGNEERGLYGFLPDGKSPDSNFGVHGGYSFWASNELSFAMVEDEAHRLLIAGRNRLAPAKFVVLRHMPKGAPDPTFGVAGASVTLIGDESNGSAIAVQKDGRIVVGGEREAGAVLSPAFARYWP